MKFRRSYRGRGRHTYTIRAASSFMDQGLLKRDRGLHAAFIDGFFDSQNAQDTLGWKDEERDLVERYLMAHGDFGHGLYLDASEPLAASMPGPEAAPAVEGQPAPSLTTICIAQVEKDGETEMCGKPTVDVNGEFCAEHAEAFATAEGT